MVLEKTKLLEQQYDVLGHNKEQYTEIRDILNGRSYYAKGKEDFVKTASQFLDRDIYVGINPRSEQKGDISSIKYLTCVVVDIDPIRPKGEPSTAEQLESSHNLGRNLCDKLQRGYLVSSGSGAHIYFPVSPQLVTNSVELTKSIKGWMDLIRRTYGTETLKIDYTFDLPRVIRVWGSFNTRSKRQCFPVEPPSEFKRYDFTFNQKEQTVVPEKKENTLPGEDRLRRLASTNKRLGEILNGSISFESRSEADYDFVRILANAHFSFEEIKELSLLNPLGRGKEIKDEDIQRIINKVIPTDSFSLIRNSSSYFRSLRSRSMGIRTGFKQFDEMVSGLKPQKLYIIAARPNDGKTTLITQMLCSVAERGNPVLFYPTEVGSEPIFDKILSRKTGLDLKKFQNGTFLAEDYEKIEKAGQGLKTLPITVVEEFGATVEMFDGGIRSHAPAVLAIDFFQALKWNDPSDVGEKAGAVRRLKELAGDHNIPIVVASQLNRTEGKLDLRQLKGTGAIEELGDVIAYLFGDDKISHPRPVSLVVMKSKYSATGMINMDFYTDKCEFVERENALRA